MHDLGPGHPAQTHDRHFEQARLDLADELRVFLYSVDDNNVIGLDRYPVGVHRASFSLADLYRVHAVVDGRPQRFRGLSEVLEHFDLPIGCAAAVASHGWQDQRPAALVLDGCRHRGQHLDHAAHATAAGRDEHGLAGFDGLEQVCAFKLFPGAAQDIEVRTGFKGLFENVQFGEIHLSIVSRQSMPQHQLGQPQR